MTAVSVSCEGLSKFFGATRAVDGVSLTIAPGELFFLLGPSGCGKTTLLRCVAGFIIPDAGRIVIGSREVTRDPPHKRDTGMVFQSYALWPHLSVRENVAFGLEMRRCSRDEIRRRVEEVLALVRMSEKADAKPTELSGGQQQRVALARALVIHPQCILLDEPLSNLDAKLRLEMRGEIRRICKESGLTAIYVTHDQKEALAIADRLAVLQEGRVAQMGTPMEVYARPATTFVASFIGETNFLRGRVAGHQSGGVEVDTALGRVVCADPPGGAPATGEVTLSIRPEVLHFGAPPAAARNVFEGTLHHTVYLGELAQHEVTLRARNGAAGEGGPSWKACELNPKLVARDHAEAVRVWIAPEDVVLLRS